jgi:RimJ/RimL family protein N-acetyltransferase
MKLLPIEEKLAYNQALAGNPSGQEVLHQCIDFYKRVGFVPPWICYYVEENGRIVGSAGFKGPPVNDSVEIAYGTFEAFRQQGIGTRICKQLVELSLQTDPAVRITARTFDKDNFSARILLSNHFRCLGTVEDPEDGQVWEWVLKPQADLV